jgi:hypothetical protein
MLQDNLASVSNLHWSSGTEHATFDALELKRLNSFTGSILGDVGSVSVTGWTVTGNVNSYATVYLYSVAYQTFAAGAWFTLDSGAQISFESGELHLTHIHVRDEFNASQGTTRCVRCRHTGTARILVSEGANLDMTNNEFQTCTSVVTIRGRGATASLSGSSSGFHAHISSPFNVVEFGVLHITGVSFEKVKNGVINVESGGHVWINDVRFHLSQSTTSGFSGGAIALHNGFIEAVDCKFISCTSNEGGSVYIDAASNATFSDCTFSDSTALSSGGGAISVRDHSSVFLDRCQITNSIGSGGGGSVRVVDHSTLLARNCLMADAADTLGGHVHVSYGSKATINDTLIVGGQAHHGGAVFLSEEDSVVILNNCTLRSNTAFQGGSIFAFQYAKLFLNAATVAHSVASYLGGGIFVQMQARVVVQQQTNICFCSAQDGGGIYVLHSGHLTLNGATIANNSASNGVGGVAVKSAQFFINDTLFLRNVAQDWVLSGIAANAAGLQINGESKGTLRSSTQFLSNSPWGMTCYNSTVAMPHDESNWMECSPSYGERREGWVGGWVGMSR